MALFSMNILYIYDAEKENYIQKMFVCTRLGIVVSWRSAIKSIKDWEKAGTYTQVA